MITQIASSTSSTMVCEKEGHCPHEGTAVGSLYCCRCGQYLYTISQLLNFYVAEIRYG